MGFIENEQKTSTGSLMDELENARSIKKEADRGIKMPTCPNCGSIIMQGNPYCTHCGTTLSWENDDYDSTYRSKPIEIVRKNVPIGSFFSCLYEFNIVRLN